MFHRITNYNRDLCSKNSTNKCITSMRCGEFSSRRLCFLAGVSSVTHKRLLCLAKMSNCCFSSLFIMCYFLLNLLANIIFALHILPLYLKVYYMLLFDSLNPQDIINLQKMVSRCLIKLQNASILLDLSPLRYPFLKD